MTLVPTINSVLLTISTIFIIGYDRKLYKTITSWQNNLTMVSIIPNSSITVTGTATFDVTITENSIHKTVERVIQIIRGCEINESFSMSTMNCEP